LPAAATIAPRGTYPRAQMCEYPVDHLDVYDGPGRDKMLTEQIDFARRAVERKSWSRAGMPM